MNQNFTKHYHDMAIKVIKKTLLYTSYVKPAFIIDRNNENRGILLKGHDSHLQTYNCVYAHAISLNMKKFSIPAIYHTSKGFSTVYTLEYKLWI